MVTIAITWYPCHVIEWFLFATTLFSYSRIHNVGSSHEMSKSGRFPFKSGRFPFTFCLPSVSFHLSVSLSRETQASLGLKLSCVLSRFSGLGRNLENYAMEHYRAVIGIC